jgi:hypothetical protein
MIKNNHNNTLIEDIRKAQQARYAKEHAIAMDMFPWIAESINAYRNATPEQLAQVEAITSKRVGF